MKIDELITELEQVKEEHGNLEVKVDDDGRMFDPNTELRDYPDRKTLDQF